MHLTLRRREGWVIGDTENRFASDIKARSLRLFALNAAPVSLSLSLSLSFFSASVSSLCYHPSLPCYLFSITSQAVSIFLSVLSFSLPVLRPLYRDLAWRTVVLGILNRHFVTLFVAPVSDKIAADNWDGIPEKI